MMHSNTKIVEKAPLLPIGITFLLGIIAASHARALFDKSLFTLFFLSFIVIVLFFIYLRHRISSHIFMFLLIFLTGAARFISFNETPRNNIKFILTDKPEVVYLRGTVVNNPKFVRKIAYFPEMDFLLRADAVGRQSKWRKVSGLVLVKAYFKGTQVIEYGDRLVLKGKIMYPSKGKTPSRFDYRNYLARKKIFGLCKIGKKDFIKKIFSPQKMWIKTRRALYSLKDRASRVLFINLSPPHSNIVAAMLLGERQHLDKPLKDLFAKTGTMHILAISGLHIGIIAFIFLLLFKTIRIPEKLRYILTVILIFFYAVMIGERASVWRATIMVGVFLLGFVMNRRASLLNLLSLALLLLLFANPNYIFDIGFTLSFVCIASIIWISPLTDRMFKIDKPNILGGRPKIWRYTLKSLSISTSIWVGIFPIIAYYFHIVTPLTIIANLIVIPICFGMISVGIAALLLGAYLPKVAIFLYGILRIFDSTLLCSLKFLSHIPAAYLDIKDFHRIYIFIYYIVLVLIIARYHNWQLSLSVFRSSSPSE